MCNILGSFFSSAPSRISPVPERAWKTPVPPKEVPAASCDRPKDRRLGMGSGERVGGVPALLGVASIRGLTSEITTDPSCRPRPAESPRGDAPCPARAGRARTRRRTRRIRKDPPCRDLSPPAPMGGGTAGTSGLPAALGTLTDPILKTAGSRSCRPTLAEGPACYDLPRRGSQGAAGLQRHAGLCGIPRCRPRSRKGAISGKGGLWHG